MAMFQKLKDKCKQYKTKAVVAAGGVAGTLSATVGNAAAAGNLSDVGPIIQDAASLMPDVLTLIIATVGIVVAGAVIGFITGIFDGILGMIKLK